MATSAPPHQPTTRPAPAVAACEHHGCLHDPAENVLTVASAVTLSRTVGCLVLISASIATGRESLLFLGLATHWVGDLADGLVARARSEETRAGAVLDIVCDRLCIALYYVSYGHLHHEMLPAIALFLFQFMVLDAQLSLAFLGWPLRSLNYFDLVDHRVHRWNWSPAGKALNGGALAVLMVVGGSPVLCCALVVVVAAVKVASLMRLHRRGIPTPTGCATTVARTSAGAGRRTA
jgi:CDP-diacylglycerol---glycerol-3-phosphate 3-phosphatidyltransferase